MVAWKDDKVDDDRIRGERMKTKAAVLRDIGKDWEIIELDLDPPRAGEVLVRFVASGLCHSDDHLRTGDIPVRYPIVGGHEGAGIVEEVGAGVTHLKPGDHIVCSFLPACGRCRFCARGQTNLCDMGYLLVDNSLPDGTFRFHAEGQDFGQMCLVGTFSQWATVSVASCIKIDDDLPLETVALVGCGVPTGFGTSVKLGAVRPGDTVVVYGIGGVGINAVQGAAIAGATNVIAVDPLPNKREAAEKLGATHSVATADEAQQLVTDLTRGVGADEALITVGVVTQDVVDAAFAVIRKHGTLIITGLAGPGKKTIQLSSFELTLFQKRVEGALFGGGNPFDDIPLMLDLYRAGKLKLDELVTTRYRLDDVNQGYRDLLEGRNIRGLLIHEH
jgi:S-(hydroxymethyl)glutathione dehydrogenase/alcohol dehydrogenase